MTDRTDVARYAAAVRAALADLPTEERESLLEDLEDHLTEVAAEYDVPLAQRLGTPEEYGAELRAAYGARKPHAVPGWLDYLERALQWPPRTAVRFRRLYYCGLAIIIAGALIGGWLTVTRSYELSGGGLHWVSVLLPNLVLLLLIFGFLYYMWTYALSRRGGSV